MTDEPDTHEVDPARLRGGRWDHEEEAQVGEGDIAASYSGDVIALASRIRKPFNHHAGLWTCIGLLHRPDDRVMIGKAYRLVHADGFEGEATTYAEKTRDCEAARADPGGFYHGMKVAYGAQGYVMTGPHCVFVPGEVTQPGLFGGQ